MVTSDQKQSCLVAGCERIRSSCAFVTPVSESNENLFFQCLLGDRNLFEIPNKGGPYSLRKVAGGHWKQQVTLRIGKFKMPSKPNLTAKLLAVWAGELAQGQEYQLHSQRNGCGSQHPCGHSQLSGTQVFRVLVLYGLCRYWECICCTYMYTGKTLIHIK